MPQPSGYIFVVISALTLGAANIFYKKSTEAIGSFNTSFLYFCFATVIATVVWLIFREPGRVTWANIRYPIITAALLSTSVITFTYGLTTTEVSISSTVRALAFLFTLILSVIFLREKLSVRQYFGIGTAVLSIFLLVS